MAGLTMRVEQGAEHGAHRFAKRLMRIDRELEHMPQVAEAVFKGLEEYHHARWGAGTRDTDATDRRWPQHQPLDLTGELKESLTKPRHRSKFAVREITPVHLKFGTRVPYARFLQRGTRKMNRKPVLRTDRAVRAVIGKLVRNHILRDD